jgi:gas vesicle protein
VTKFAQKLWEEVKGEVVKLVEEITSKSNAELQKELQELKDKVSALENR